MERLKVDKIIFYKNQNKVPTWKDIKDIEFQDDDIIKAEWVEPFYSENESWDGHFLITITREVDETDEEMEKRIARETKRKAESRRSRYEYYLKLKKEFDPTTNTKENEKV